MEWLCIASVQEKPMSILPRAFHQIRLELTREPGYPQGNSGARENDRDVGHLLHGPGAAWSFLYGVSGDNKDEAGFHLENEKFVTGEYVSIREDKRLHTYRVVSVEHL